MPFPENKVSTIIVKKITDRERPQRPLKEKLRLLDELWVVIQSFLAHKVEERLLVFALVDFQRTLLQTLPCLKSLPDSIPILKHMSKSSTICLSMQITHFWGCERRRPSQSLKFLIW